MTNKLQNIPELKGVNIFKEKTLLLCQTIDSENELYCDGSTMWTANKNLFKEVKKQHETNYIITECLKCKTNAVHKDLLECHKDITKLAHTLKIVSNYKINLFITGTLKHTAFKLLFNFINDTKTKFDMINDPVHVSSEREYKWLNSCSGALIHCVNGYKGEVEGYDVNSYYSSIMKSPVEFPISHGEFKTITGISDTPLFGLYRAVISGNINRFLFRVNKDNIYTHIDIKRAKELNYKVELLQDGYDNFLYYAREKRAVGKTLFKKYVDFLFEIRNKNKNLIEKDVDMYLKLLLSGLWGFLCEERKFRYTVKADGSSNYKEIEGDEILRMTPLKDGAIEYEIRNIHKPYKTRYARMKIFLLSHGRNKMSSMLEDNIDNVVRVQTDGFMVKPTENKIYEIGLEIGNLKLEYNKCSVEIQNVNTIYIICPCGCKFKKKDEKNHYESEKHISYNLIKIVN